MQQTADWLQKFGLGQYAQRFAENDITFSILPDLTDQHLKELGVLSLGQRFPLGRVAIGSWMFPPRVITQTASYGWSGLRIPVL